jgi:hypothetical protein
MRDLLAFTANVDFFGDKFLECMIGVLIFEFHFCKSESGMQTLFGGWRVEDGGWMVEMLLVK